MKRHLCFTLILCTLRLLTVTAQAQEQFTSRYSTTYVSMENGLLHNFVDDIYKDTNGFLWISTGGGGLSRYDGYEFIHYNINTPEAKLKSNFISASCEDNFHRLWIISQEGVDILDLNTRKLVLPGDPDGRFGEIVHHPALNITKDTQGNIWLYGANVLRKISFQPDGNIAAIYTLTSIPASVQEMAMADVDEDGHIWVGLGNKVCKIITTDDGRLLPTPAAAALEFEPDIVIRALCVKENEVWMGTETGLIRYNWSEDILKRYYYDGNNPRSLTQNFISDLAITAEKQLLVSTLRGINVYNPVTDDFEQILQDSKNPGNILNSNFINCMMIDRDIIWIGTESGGINKMTPRSLSLRNYVHSTENPKSISPNPVNAIYEDSKGNLWVGTVEGGLNKRAKGSDNFTHYTTENAGLCHNSVSSIVGDDKNQLWVGTWGMGINVFDIDHPERGPRQHIASWFYDGIPVNFVGSMCYDNINKLMWIGTNWGIYYYDTQTGTLHSPFEDDTLAKDIHSSLGAVIDSQGRLWMGSTEGIYVFDLHTRRENHFAYTHLKYKLDDPASGLSERISSFLIASDGTLWVGSNGCGLYKHIPATDGSIGTFQCYTTEHGLINNIVRGILEDDRHELWISTNNGLSCFNPATGKFTNYTRYDGLPGNLFYWNAYSPSHTGLLYFGSVEGLTAIDPNRLNVRKLPAHVTLTKLSVMNEEIRPGDNYIQTDISTARSLQLHESDKSFSLEFSALNFEAPATSVYSYRLAGFDEQWIQVPATRRFASYTNIRAGKYTFQVRYSPDGATFGEITELPIHVRPFFYKTLWFVSIMLTLIVCLIIYIDYLRIRTLQKQKERLHRKVEERTRELNEQKTLLEHQTEELSRQNEILTQQNEKITRQKTQLIQMSKKVQELTMDKISFFTSITHEFRTPITLIIGPIERALKLSINPLVIEQLNFVERNSKYLLSLVNQLMDFRKVESGKMEINRTQGDFEKFIRTILTPFENFAADRRITLQTYIRLASPEFMFDPEAMQKVVTNLLSNAIKFTPDGGTVKIYAASLTDRETGKETLYFCVKDTGTGIPPADLERIFNRFYQVKSHLKYPVYGQSGTGIGLYLCKSMVRLHGGIIRALNNRKGGSSFRILLPIQRNESEPAHDLTIGNPHVLLSGAEQPQLPPNFVPGRLTILIVEDNPDMRSFIRSILIEQYNILEAEDGAKALAVLSRSNVDFIVSDLMMPVMDGIEFSQRVRENFTTSHIPFLMLTAKTSEEARIESYKTGVDSYLMKPFNDELLLTRIAGILENRKRYQQRFAANMDISALQMEEESSDKKFLDKALEVIRENYKNSYYESTDFIEAMGVSKSLLNKKLQTLTGQSIGQFIRNYRLNIARELIEKNKVTRNMNISEIAYEVGFNDPKYFTRCFSKRYNVPPSSLLDEG